MNEPLRHENICIIISWFVLVKSMYQHRSTWASMLMVIPFHVMAMVIQNLGFRWRSENQEHFLKEQNYNWALSKTGFGDVQVYKY